MNLVGGNPVTRYYKYCIVAGNGPCYLIFGSAVNVNCGVVCVAGECPYHQESFCIDNISDYRKQLQPVYGRLVIIEAFL